MADRIHLDFELAGTLSLPKVGADVWTKDQNTVPLMVGFAINDEQAECFLPDDPRKGQDYYRFTQVVGSGAEIHAWNAPFEWAVWHNIMVRRYGWGPLPIERFHCTMATAAYAGLPMDLEDAANAIGSPFTKDKAGAMLMKRMAMPRSYTMDGEPIWWHRTDLSKLTDLIRYNLADVEAERAISKRIPRMSPAEREIWLVDHAMNQRGLPVDDELLEALERITHEELARLNNLISSVTGGAVTGASQGARLLAWLRERGCPLDTLKKGVLDQFLNDAEAMLDMEQDVQDVLRLRAEAAKTSTAKLKSIAAYSQVDSRARNLVQYGGAVRTLRWAGRGPQIQNFPRPVIKHVNRAIDEILQGMSAEGLRQIFGRPLDVVSSCLKGVFKALPGFKFVVADFHAIEAIVLAWLADHRDILDVFRRKEDVYVFTAKQVGSQDRQLGKVLRLACGYGMGAGKFRKTAEGSGLYLTDEQAEEAVRAFRTANKPIVSLWYRYEGAAKNAIANPGTPFEAGPVRFFMAPRTSRAHGSLLIEKPGKGHLVYRDAKVVDGRVVYQGVDQATHQWGEISTYGGKICLAGDTLVLTECGWLRLDHITNECVWDGERFVQHSGLFAKGRCPVVTLDGIHMTSGHKILTVKGWVRASSCEGFDRAPVALPDGAPICGSGWQEIALARALRLWGGEDDGRHRVQEGGSQILWMSALRAGSESQADARHVQASSFCGLARDARQVPVAHTSGLAELRRARDHGLPGMGNFREILERYGSDVSVGAHSRAGGQHGRVFGGKLRLGDIQGSGQQPTQQVYDLIDAGPRRRFVVAGRTGPLIVHNCENVTQSVARDLLAYVMVCLENAIPGALLTTVHDEIVAMTAEEDATEALALLKWWMSKGPVWAGKMPLSASGFIADRYGKG